MALSEEIIPRIPLGTWGDNALMWLRENASVIFDVFSEITKFLVEALADGLKAIPAILLLAIFACAGWGLRSWRLALNACMSFLLVMGLRQWEQMLDTMAMVIIATLVAVVIALPVGIWAAKNDRVSAVVRPILDFMQTMPAFVYLLPAVMFFSIGVVPGTFSTIIFALAPGVRMTELGIRHVDPEVVEAGRAYGATDRQILRGIELPMAMPSIMAGINQIIMLSLSMAVIAGMVGADGLGKEVVAAISTLNLGQGLEAGLAVVILAVFLDRLTAALGNSGDYPSSLLARWRKARRQRQKGRVEQGLVENAKP
ncbi:MULTISPECIES: proline/glycine betaine ABC transporter permease [Corynebacterium]|jgi:proline/glycine betaine ABC superfamily ATP binding cassette transporter, permease protein|uniref:ABC transporter permease n=1 Tax=Corynebacterium TaxID=1716 RepID=UPI0007EB41BE|nr:MULTISPECIES: proline/glycine betaine ABC transporter permease [Corynebacterium]MCG7251604.1 proline/glycine betaine ABC transporter permease [Corynebacterium pseudodiphtheriticum]MCT1634662.1 proline/glycine betaine ABC transporter permease [Corynebacterium pseudodiphtheriticum]MCT1665757.1 proline/glycine betaine ABC transporter permease [Corynebacterium pseudodiphtheriticum]MDK4273202.1 proline/glycine betaine ABC transporter permease [Corynebacterium pseudodiphtheriticum]MDK4317171.1 pr